MVASFKNLYISLYRCNYLSSLPSSQWSNTIMYFFPRNSHQNKITYSDIGIYKLCLHNEFFFLFFNLFHPCSIFPILTYPPGVGIFFTDFLSNCLFYRLLDSRWFFFNFLLVSISIFSEVSVRIRDLPLGLPPVLLLRGGKGSYHFRSYEYRLVVICIDRWICLNV